MAPPRPNPLALRTPAQTAAYVKTNTQAAMAPERLAIQAAQKAAQREALANQQRIMGFAQAAAAQLQQGVPQTENAYHQAVTDQQGLAAGFSQQMRDRLAGVAGAPAGAADATYNLGGVIPGNRLSADAVAQLGLAQSQPATQLGLGQVGLRGSAYNAQNQNKGFLDQLTTLAAKEPGVRQQFLNQVQQQEQQKIAEQASLQKLGIDQSSLAFDQNYKTSQLGLERQRVQLARQKQQQSYKLAQQKIADGQNKPSASLSGKYGYIVDAQGNAVLDANGKRIPVVKARSSSSNAAGTPRGDAYNYVVQHFLGTSQQKYKPTAIQKAQALTIGAGKPVKTGIYIARPGAKGVFPAYHDAAGNLVIPATTNKKSLALTSGSNLTIKQQTNFLMNRYGLTRNAARAIIISASKGG